MFLLMVKLDSKNTYNLCYKYLDEVEARAQYNRLLEKYPPRKIAFIETTDAVFGVTYNKDTLTPTVGSITIPIATESSPGAIQLATILQTDFDNPIDYVDGIPVSVPPSLIKAMITAGIAAIAVPDATTETSGKVRLANSIEADYTTANDGLDALAVMQPLETKNMIDYAAQYETEYSPSVTNIKEALDNIYEQINYVPLEITTFQLSGTMYEIGLVPTITCSWSYNKNQDIVWQKLNNQDIVVNLRSYSLQNISSTQDITLSASDSTDMVTKSIRVTFTNKIYWGESEIPVSLNSSWVKSLSHNELSTTYKGTYAFNAGSNEYAFIAIPASYNPPTNVYINSWLTELVDCGNIDFTSDTGIVSQYKILRTTNKGLGSFNMVFN